MKFQTVKLQHSPYLTNVINFGLSYPRRISRSIGYEGAGASDISKGLVFASAQNKNNCHEVGIFW